MLGKGEQLQQSMLDDIRGACEQEDEGCKRAWHNPVGASKGRLKVPTCEPLA